MLSKIRTKAERLVWLLRNGRVPQAIGFASQFVLGHSLYIDHLKKYFASDQLPVEVVGNVMYLSPSDPGISAELFHFGMHEPEATEIMRRAFEQLAESSDDPVVLDIGSHRGYYAFQAADILSEEGTIHAFEPEPSNFAALRRGIETNGFENVHAERCAIGAENTTGELKTAWSSNSHTLRSIPDGKSEKYTGETVETEIRKVDSYLDESGIDPEEIDLLRIDVEGYESAVFEGIEAVLNADSELLVFVELHPHRVEPAKLHSIIDALEAAGFQLVHASSSADSDLPDYDAVRRHTEVRAGRHTVDLIVERRRPEAFGEVARNGTEADAEALAGSSGKSIVGVPSEEND